MSLATQLIAAVTQAQDEIKGEIGRMQAYLSELDATAGRVEQALEGSTLSHHDQLVERLAATKREAEETVQQLSAAYRQLDVVRNI